MAIVVVIALLAFFDRGGYSDADGTPLTLLDSVYDATVTATTTGYGEIAPISPFVLHDLLAAGHGLDLVEHRVGPAEDGQELSGSYPGLSVAVVRGEQRLADDGPAAQRLRLGDTVGCVRGGSPGA